MKYIILRKFISIRILQFIKFIITLCVILFYFIIFTEYNNNILYSVTVIFYFIIFIEYNNNIIIIFYIL